MKEAMDAMGDHWFITLCVLASIVGIVEIVAKAVVYVARIRHLKKDVDE